MGISLARDLREKGYRVTILEGNETLGGLTVAASMGKYIWDKFYHVILPDDSHTIELIKFAGLGDELVWNETRTGFYIKGSYYSMSNIMEFIKFPTLNLFDKFRLGLTILAGSRMKNYERLEKIPVTTWLKRWSGKRVYENIWHPLLKAKLGEGYKLTSAAFICATIKRLYGARKSKSQKEVFGYVNGGYAAILNGITAKLDELGIDTRTGFKVKKVFHDEKGLKVVSPDGEELAFDYVISTLPSHLTARIAPALSAAEIQALNDIKYLGVACVSLLLKKEISPYYVTNITDSRVPFTGLIEMTALVDRKFFDGHSLVYLPKYVNSENEIFTRDEDKFKQDFISELKKMNPGLKDEDILSSSVARARHVITLPEMGYSKKLPAFTTSIPGFYIINSSYITDGTLNVNETLKVAKTWLPKVLNTIDK